jgi:signal transduction histidine kinase
MRPRRARSSSSLVPSSASITPAVPSAPALVARYRAASAVIGGLVAALGVAMLAGWAAGLEHSVHPGGGPLMKPNAAACCILAGLALVLAQRGGPVRAVSAALAAATSVLALATLAQWVLGVDLRFDELLFRDDTQAYTSVPGRMAPNTALAFALLGAALLLAGGGGRRLRVARTLAIVALAIGAIACAGYLYGVSPLFAVARRTGMALPAAGGLVALAAGVLLARPETGSSALLASDGPGGALARWLLPVAVTVPVLLALPAQAGVRGGILDQAYASALVTVGLTGVLAWVVISAARAVDARDAARREREREIERLNAALEQRAVELAAANRELEAFSYSVSHDLRSPLRSIDGFGQALVEDCAGVLPPVGVSHVGRIRAATQRMGRLIDDLLQLARVTRTELRHEPVNLSALAREIAAELGAGAPERKVTFEIEDGLAARGDPTLLRVLLDNLLGNAFKFTSRRSSARIQFGRTLRDDRPAFFVRDDGAGFDMAYAKQLFGAFQRLHGAAEFTGTGIGLATAQRIVRRHGGEIWAEGAVDQGATLTFSLPAEGTQKGAAA